MSNVHQQELRNEIRRLTAAIANVFTIEGDLAEADVEALHNQFVAAIESVNARLRNCDELLRKGLRQEAIQDSEIEPNLLDLVTELDIPEWTTWADYVRQFGIPPQPELLLNVAAELNEAYTQAEPLDTLLRLHRLHSLARSPLADRLSVLRQVANRDPANPVWKDDIKSYERNRLHELENEVRQLSGANNLRGLSDLRRELTESTWLLPIPKALLERVIQSHQRVLVADARKKLEDLERTIYAAFSEFNEVRATRAREEWRKYEEIAGLTAEDELSLRVRAAFDWLSEVEQNRQEMLEFEHASRALQEALDDGGTTRGDLTRLYSNAERFEQPVSERLQRRYAERLASLDLAERRRSRLLIVTSFTVIGIVAALALFAIQWRIRGSKIEAACNGMEQLLDAGQLSEAATYYDRVSKDLPYAANSSRMQQLKARLSAEGNEDQARKNRFAGSLEMARRLAEDDESMESLVQSLSELHKAESIVKSETELAELKSLERDVRKQQNLLQKDIDDHFQKEVASIVEKAKQLLKLTDLELEDLQREAEILSTSPQVTDSVLRGGNLTLLVSAVAEELKRRKDEFGKNQAIAALHQSIGKSANYERALRNYLKYEPAGERSEAFKSVLDLDIPYLETVHRWNTLADQWNGMSLSPDTEYGSTAKAIIAQVKKDFVEYPSASLVLPLSDYVDSICNRTDSSGKTILRGVKDILSSDIFSMNYLVFDGEPIYFLNRPKDSANALAVDRLLDVRDLSKYKSKSCAKNKLAMLPNQTLWDLSPHGQFARKVLPLLTNEQQTFELRVCAVLSQLFENKDIDPILKCGLMQVMIAAVKPGSLILAQEMQEFEDAITTDTDLSDVNWLSMDDGLVKTARGLTQGNLARVTQTPREIYVSRIEPRVRESFSERPKLTKLVWVGALSKNTEGTWQCIFASETDPDLSGELVIRDFSDPTNTRFISIGHRKQGKTVLDGSQLPQLTDGRLVFIQQ